MLRPTGLSSGRSVLSVAKTAVPAPAFAGVDRAESNHVACLVDTGGEVIERITVGHDKAGIGRLVAVLAGREVAGVGIERGDGPLVTALLTAGLPVFVIAPSQMSPPRPDNRATPASSRSAGPSTNNYATRSATSPATAA